MCWGGVSNPSQHNATHYRYLVHSLTEEEAVDFEVGDLRAKPYLSCSLINQDHRATMGSGGVILCAQSADIQVLSPRDIGVLEDADAEVPEITEADQLLAKTLPYAGCHNEVRLRPKGVTAAGVFMVSRSRQSRQRPLFNKLQALANRLNLPVILIDEPPLV
jgi:hypothetical protein